MELLLGMAPMNQLDASAIPMDIFNAAPDLTPYKAVVPTVAAGNLLTTEAKDKASAEWIKKTLRQNFSHADLADPAVLNTAIWFACKGSASTSPRPVRLPVFEALRLGMLDAEAEQAATSKKDDDWFRHEN
jgi:hypothetical protein